MNKLKIYSITITILTIILLIAIISIFSSKKTEITKTEAQKIAYKYANVNEKDISITKIKEEPIDNEFEIEFTDEIYKYEFEIDSKTGRVINFEKDIINKNSKENKKEETKVTSTTLDESDAKKIALEHVGTKEKEVTFTKSKIDREDGKTVYEFEFFDKNNEYEICVDINTSKIVKYSKESLELTENKSNEYIDSTKAKEIVLNHAKLKNNDVIWHNVELDIDYNIKTYEIEFYYNNLTYEYEIDAINGTILKFETDRD